MANILAPEVSAPASIPAAKGLLSPEIGMYGGNRSSAHVVEKLADLCCGLAFLFGICCETVSAASGSSLLTFNSLRSRLPEGPQ
ncbi:MAG TPA: hypothetical protein VI685_09085, partial [Candidatus Angelobacter sp.]